MLHLPEGKVRKSFRYPIIPKQHSQSELYMHTKYYPSYKMSHAVYLPNVCYYLLAHPAVHLVLHETSVYPAVT